MRRLLFAVLVLGLLVLVGCGAWVAPVVPPQGFAFSAVKAPLDTNVGGTTLGNKMGESSSYCLLFGLLSFGDASIASAARKGNVDVIHHADYDYMNAFGFLQIFTTVVYGE